LWVEVQFWGIQPTPNVSQKKKHARIWRLECGYQYAIWMFTNNAQGACFCDRQESK